MRQITFEAGDAEKSVLLRIIKSLISPSIFITQRWETPCLKAYYQSFKAIFFILQFCKFKWIKFAPKVGVAKFPQLLELEKKSFSPYFKEYTVVVKTFFVRLEETSSEVYSFLKSVDSFPF